MSGSIRYSALMVSTTPAAPPTGIGPAPQAQVMMGIALALLANMPDIVFALSTLET